MHYFEKVVKDIYAYAARVKHYYRNNDDFARRMKADGFKRKEFTKEQESEIIAFYSPYHKISSVIHQFYYSATGRFDVKYIPESIWYYYIDKFFNNWDMADYYDNKCFYHTLFFNVKQPDVVVYCMNGYWYDGKIQVGGGGINQNDAISLIHNNVPCVVKKATNSLGGKGVFFIDKKTSLSEIEEMVKKCINDDIVVQKVLSQSKVLSTINASSINTIRLLTLLRRNGTVKICSIVLRMGVGGSKVDNASSGGIVVGVDEDGRLKDVAYNVKGERFFEHPDSHIKFNDFFIPNFDKIKQIVQEQAVNLPYFRLVSWDIAIDENNEPVLIEANLCRGELDFHQLTNGPVFGDDTEEILNEVFNDKLLKK